MYEAAIETVSDGAAPLPPDTGDENDEGSDDGGLLLTAAGIGLAAAGAGLILFLRRRPTAG